MIGPINKDSPEDYENDTSLSLTTIEDSQPQGKSKFEQLSQRTHYQAFAKFDFVYCLWGSSALRVNIKQYQTAYTWILNFKIVNRKETRLEKYEHVKYLS